MKTKQLIARILGYSLFIGFIVAILVLMALLTGNGYISFIVLFGSAAILALIFWISKNWNAD